MEENLTLAFGSDEERRPLERECVRLMANVSFHILLYLIFGMYNPLIVCDIVFCNT
jgi:hypothetical protein